MNPAILDTARHIASDILKRGDALEGIYPIPVGARFMYLSANQNKIFGPDIIDIAGTVFYVGFKRENFS